MALYQKLQRNDAKTVYASVESYKEFFNDTKINKEDVSFAKIGPEWPRRIKNWLREFLRNWVNVFASNPALPNAYHGPKFSFLRATPFQRRMYRDGCHLEKKLKCKGMLTSCCKTALSTSLISHGLLW